MPSPTAPGADPSSAKVELDLELLLPGSPDERDGCRERLTRGLAGLRGLTRAHVESIDGRAVLCVHYDPALVTLPSVERVARRAGAEVAARYRHEVIPVEGMDCSDCTLAIEHALGRAPGVLTASVSYAAGTLRVEYDSRKTDRKALVDRLRALGYGVPKGPLASFLDERRELILSLLAGALVLSGWLVSRFTAAPGEVAAGLYAAAYLAGGFDVARHAWHSLKTGRFDTDLLMVTAALGAAAIGEAADGALLLFLFSLGHALEELALDRARRAVSKLGALTPKTALVRRDGREAEVPVEGLSLEDVVVVRPGVRLPIDGRIVAGASAVDQSPVTGESVPVDKGTGDAVFAGSVNGEGVLEVQVTRLAKDSTLSRVMQLVEEAQGQKARTQRTVEGFTGRLVPAVLITAALLIVLPPLFGTPFRDSFLRAMTLLVAASPCALALAAPSAMLAGIGQAARHGVLVKGGVHLETLGAIEAVAFDKTGTLTHGKPELTRVVPLEGSGFDEDRLLALAAAVEKRSGHPLAQAVVRAAERRSLQVAEAGELASLTGRGIRAQVNGSQVRLGNRKLFEEARIPIPPALWASLRDLESDGGTTIIVGVGSEAVGVLALADEPRANARQTIERLHRLGVRETFLLTGDNPLAAARVARALGIDTVRAGLLPEHKVAAIRELAAGRVLAMVGDGVNDAPALAAASVGIAMGGAGTDVALETADVALMGDDLGKLPFAVGLGRATRTVLRQNLGVALVVMASLVVAAATGLAGVGSAIVLHEGSTLAVALNSLRLLRHQDS
jgi:Cd2+/Zn2+-exporting ATPase